MVPQCGKPLSASHYLTSLTAISACLVDQLNNRLHTTTGIILDSKRVSFKKRANPVPTRIETNDLGWQESRLLIRVHPLVRGAAIISEMCHREQRGGALPMKAILDIFPMSLRCCKGCLLKAQRAEVWIGQKPQVLRPPDLARHYTVEVLSFPARP